MLESFMPHKLTKNATTESANAKSKPEKWVIWGMNLL
jgi:hypothetical protein